LPDSVTDNSSVPRGESARAAPPAEDEHPFVYGPNPLRLRGRDWAAAGVLLVVISTAICLAWPALEKFDPEPDYRIPYDLSSDFWMYSRWCERAASDHEVLVIGDSSIWGHYVDAKDTLTGCLNRLAGESRFANLGLSGLHPVAMAGLLEHHCRAISGKKVVLHFGPLWLHSEQADLSGEKEFHFQHKELAPQFRRDLKCYKADIETRLGRYVDCRFPVSKLTNHAMITYFDNDSVLEWMVANPYSNPLGAVNFEINESGEKAVGKPVPWSRKIKRKKDYAWVSPKESLQWAFFRRSVDILRGKSNEVFVLIGPFNPHLLMPASEKRYRSLITEVEAWLGENDIGCFVVPDLPTEEYGDASHPLGNGYVMIARKMLSDESFKMWGR